MASTTLSSNLWISLNTYISASLLIRSIEGNLRFSELDAAQQSDKISSRQKNQTLICSILGFESKLNSKFENIFLICGLLRVIQIRTRRLQWQRSLNFDASLTSAVLQKHLKPVFGKSLILWYFSSALIKFRVNLPLIHTIHTRQVNNYQI